MQKPLNLLRCILFPFLRYLPELGSEVCERGLENIVSMFRLRVNLAGSNEGVD